MEETMGVTINEDRTINMRVGEYTVQNIPVSTVFKEVEARAIRTTQIFEWMMRTKEATTIDFNEWKGYS